MTIYIATLRATDNLGGTSDKSFTFDVQTSDTVPPSVPGTPVLGTVTANSISFSWAASTDTSGISLYKVYRATPPGGAFSFLASTTNTSYTNTGMGSGVTRDYQVTAVDASSNANESGPSGTLTASTSSGDITAPTVPTGLAAVPVSASQINLSWNASTDAGGLSGYRLYSSLTSGGTYTQLAQINAPTQSYSHTGLISGSTRFYKITAFDLVNNESNQSSQVSATTTGTATSKKWHPGHYMLTSAIGGALNTLDMNGINSSANVKGVQHRVCWADLESTLGNYTLTPIADLLTQLRPFGKRLILQLMDRKTGGVSNPNGIVPSYIMTDSAYGSGGGLIKLTDSAGGTVGWRAALWRASVRTRLVALVQAIATAFDQDPLFEAINFPECAYLKAADIPPDLNAGEGGVSGRALFALRIYELCQAANTAFVRTNVVQYTNSLANQVAGLIHNNSTIKVGAGGPDVIPPNPKTPNGVPGDVIIRGAGTDTSYTTLTDYRGVVPLIYAVQAPEMGGGKEGDFTIAQLVTHAVTTQGCTHMCWTRTDTPTVIKWTSGVVPYLAGSPIPTVQTSPSTYGGNVDIS